MLRPLIRALALLACSASFSAYAVWPERPVTIIVPWGAGGAADSLARALVPHLEKEFKQQFNVANRTGGSGVVGHQAIAEAKPDGYTFGLATVEIAMFHHQGMAKFAPNDFTIVSIFNTDAGGLMVRSDSPYKSAKDLIEAIKKNPASTLKASGTGQGGIWHLGLVGWLLAEGVPANKVPWIPSQGSAPAMKDLVAGGVDFVTASLPEGRAMIEAGLVRALANMDTKRLAPAFKDVPTLKESTGTNWIALTWRGLIGPKGIPSEALDRLTPAVERAVKSKEYVDLMTNAGYGLTWLPREQGKAFVDKADSDFGRIVKEAGLAK